jgi:tetratricopeptide (TPR) repeat protein
MVAYSINIDNLYYDPLESFTDREQILNMFEQFLRTAQAGRLRLLAVKGQAGVGKTFLISYLAERLCPTFAWQAGILSYAQSTPDFRSILRGLEDALKGCVSSQRLLQYRVKRDEYNQRFDEYRATISIQQQIEVRDHASLSDVYQNVQVDIDLPRRENQLRSELSRALIELAEGNERPLCLFIDDYERLIGTGSEIVGWLWEEILPGLVKGSSFPVLVVTCGRDWPSNTTVKPFAHFAEVAEFDKQQMENYLEKLVMITTVDPLERDELVIAFRELTGGHPLILALAVTYFNRLVSGDRVARKLHANKPLIDDYARIEFLLERLLACLPEPHQTLLEWGPILRHFDQETLQSLLTAIDTRMGKKSSLLNTLVYRDFLCYPFVTCMSEASISSKVQFTFHSLIRRSQLQILHRHQPQMAIQLHHVMADYYTEIGKIEHKRETDQITLGTVSDPSKWLPEIPEKEFGARLEWFYHAFHVPELQVRAFEEWEWFVSQMVYRWLRKLAGPLLELVQQLVEEHEPFFDKTSIPYARYLTWHSRFLLQEARWEKAQVMLELAIQIFEGDGSSRDLITCLNEMGMLFTAQGKLAQALYYFERTLVLRVQVSDPIAIAQSFHNIGEIYRQQGKLEEAFNFHERALAIREQAGHPANLATTLNNIGLLYQEQGNLKQALYYFKRALVLREQMDIPSDIAESLNCIGGNYYDQGDFRQSLIHHTQALHLREQIGNSRDIATSLNNIGSVYSALDQLEEALNYFERALAIDEQEGHPAKLATTLNNIGHIHYEQKRWGPALKHFKRALALLEQTGNLSSIASVLSNIGAIYSSRGEYGLALSYHEKALSIKKQMGNPRDLAIALNNIGSIYQDQRKYEQALSYYRQSLVLFEQVDNSYEIATVLANIGHVYQIRGEAEQALSLCKQALVLFEKVGNPSRIATTLTNIGFIYTLQEELDTALDYYQRSLIFFEQVGDMDGIARCAHKIGSIYQKLGEAEKALEWYSEALRHYKSLGYGFESQVADELEGLSACYAQLNEPEKSETYQAQARLIRMRDC